VDDSQAIDLQSPERDVEACAKVGVGSLQRDALDEWSDWRVVNDTPDISAEEPPVGENCGDLPDSVACARSLVSEFPHIALVHAAFALEFLSVARH
jgi:hypothetical protein